MIDLTDLLVTFDQAYHDPAQDAHLGPSATNLACRRQTAFIFHGYPEAPRFSAASVGTMLHQVVANAWWEYGKRAGYQDGELLIEHKVVVPGLPRPGTADVIDFREKVVRDLKTLNRFKFDSWVDTGPPEYVWEQVQMYALGLEATTAWGVVLDAMCRDTGRTRTFSRQYDADVAINAVLRIAEMDGYLHATEPMDVPADGKYRDAFPCQSCSFTDACYGPDDKPYPYHPDEDQIADAASRYLAASRVATAAERDKERAKADLADAEGVFGEYVIGYYERGGTDWKAAARTYKERIGPLPDKEPTRVMTVKKVGP